MINYVVYSHTDYLDVLKIQTDYVLPIKNKTLLINTNNLDLSEIYSKYDNIIFYNDNNPYPQRVSEGLRNIDDEFILFIHDIDILFYVDDDLISQLHSFLKFNNYDRIDLKHSGNVNTSTIYECSNMYDYNTWNKHNNVKDNNNLFLIKQDDPSQYIYNVNPSIWKRESLIEIMDKFPTKNYRTIEDFDVQIFCKKYSIYKIFSKEKKECGHFDCIKNFIFFHISHNGKFVPLNGYSTIYGQSYIEYSNKYEEIINKYNLKKSNKWIQ
jgi:hypothetical protein